MKIFKRNNFVYFYAYFAAQVIFIYVNVYLPVYFFRILNVNRTELAFVQVLAYSALLIKPVISIYFDKVKTKRKILIIISSFGVVVSYAIFIINLNLLLLFGIFLGLNFICISVIDVAIDKTIVESSPDEKTKDRNASLTQLGAIIGAIFPNIIAFLIFSDIYSLVLWNQFFIIGILAIIPIIIVGLIIRVNPIEFRDIKKQNEEVIDKKSIVLISIILFLFYGERIYEYPLEPWILERFGEENLFLFLLLLLIIIIINALGVIIAGLISNKFNRKRILTISSLIYGILLIIAPFTDMYTFFLLFGIMQIFAGFMVINLISLMIEHSHNKVIYYQMMAMFVFLATVIFVPLGTYLSGIIATELIIVIAGILKILCLIPIYFLTINKNDNDYKISDI